MILEVTYAQPGDIDNTCIDKEMFKTLVWKRTALMEHRYLRHHGALLLN